MDKLRSLASNISMPSSSSATNKLSKAFKFNSDHNVLHKSHTSLARGGSSNPFLDGPQLEEPSLTKPRLWLHIASLFFTFMAICLEAAVAAFQAKWFSVSGGTGFVLFLILTSFFLTIFLITVPLIYDRWDKCKRTAQFLSQSRATLILHAFGTILMVLAAFITTVSAFTEAGCKDASNDPHSSLGNSYKAALPNWCNTKKAAAFFDWFSFMAWSALLVLAVLTFRKESRTREPGFIPPTSPSSFLPSAQRLGSGLANAGAPMGGGQGYTNVAHGEDYGDKEHGVNAHDEEQQRYDAYGGTGQGYAYPRVAPVHDSALARPSVDAYGAFDGDMPGGNGGRSSRASEEPSRTMQIAYTDPYSQIRASLLSENASYGQPPAQYNNHYINGGYGNSGLPNPPGYRYQ